METIRTFSDDKLRNAIARCRARLQGNMPLGLMDEQTTRQALRQYQEELQRRRQKYIEFDKWQE